MKASRGSKPCSACGIGQRRAGQRDCLACHAATMRAWRKTHPLTAEQRFKDTARSYASVYLRLGKIKRLPCRDCGSPDSQMHHPDYSTPLEVEWLCRPCHLALHRQQQQFAVAA